jgi:hypothetical protein
VNELEIEAIKAIVLPFLQALASGGLAGLMGYMKQEELGTSWKVIFTRKFWERFEPTKALKTVLVSMITYGVAYTFGWIPSTVEEVGIMTLIVYGVDALVKFIVRRTPISKAWNWLKTQALEIFT